ncbi:hypothetical protein OUZ56_002919 [Daphnia magna]|uniref:Uncharacterized protein n=1 Tax=Daphnia magna TaxID=35525 RepID=A0ABR0A7I4_9CRUS|nr:hypothetical protein OUZ56_002919 [Daphnia magna]
MTHLTKRKNSRKRIQAEQPEAIWAKLTSDVVTDRKSMLRACVLNKDTYSEQGRSLSRLRRIETCEC